MHRDSAIEDVRSATPALASRALLAYLGAGAVALGLYLIVDREIAPFVHLLVSLLAIAGLVAGVALFRPTGRAPWFLFVGGLATLLIADAVRFSAGETVAASTYPDAADAILVAAYVFIAAGFGLLIRRRLPGHRLRPLPHIGVAVDDAGAGFASLQHILELRPSIVKLDRALISGIDTDKARRAMAAGMRHFARASGIRLIAEGVETEAELATLRELDIHLAQGYLLGAPAPVPDRGRPKRRSARPAPKKARRMPVPVA